MNVLGKLRNAGIYTGIEHRIEEIEEKIEFDSSLRIVGRFFYLPFRDKAPTETEFANFIYHQIMRYCIPRSKIQAAQREYEKTKDERYLFDLHDQARNLFIKSIKERGAHLGEPGELIAFIILEAFFNAPQIACKMFLKTSEHMPIHGSDSVHIRMSKDGEKLELFWGEAKMYSNLSAALDQALLSISNFCCQKEDVADPRVSRDRDIDIIKDYPDVETEEMKSALLKFFDPYQKESNNWKEIYACMVGFDYSLYNELNNVEESKLSDYFRDKYIEKIKKACQLFEKEIKDKHLEELEFAFILLPFKSLKRFRKEFYKLLGITEEVLGSEND